MTGTVATTSPTISVNPTSLSFGSQTVNTTSAAMSYTLTGSNLTADITVTPPAGYAVSTTQNGTYTTSSLAVAPTSGSVNQTIYVQFTPTSTMAFNGNITNASTGATPQNVAVTGTGVNAAPVITVSTNTLTNFGTVTVGQTSASQNYTVSGINLTDNITVTAPSINFQVSLDNTTFTSSVTITQSGGNVPTTTVYVRFTPQTSGAKTGSVANASTGATTQNVAVSGTGANATTFDLTITQNAPATVASGGTLTYTLIVTETGNAITTPFDATFNLPASGYANTTVISAGCFTNSSISGTTVNLTGCTLGANASSTVTITITPNTVGTLTSGNAVVDSGSVITETNEGNNTAAGVSTTVNPVPTGIVINEVFGGGGNAGAPFNADFIELFNNGSAIVDLSGYSLQYASATGAFNAVIALPSTSIAPGSYYVIQTRSVAGGTSITSDYISPDAVDLSVTNGNVLLAAGTTSVAACPAPNATNVLDRVGYGTGNCPEITAAPAGSNTTSVQRIPNGIDTNNNMVDFRSLAPTPRAMNVAPATPTITVSPNSLTFGNQTVNTTSTAMSYTLTGSNLTANITVTAPTGYAVSTTQNGTYMPTLTVTQTGGTVNQPIYVQFTPTSGTTFTGNITNASTGATTQNVAVSGTGVAANTPPTISAVNVSRVKGSTSVNSQIASVGDANQAADTLSVTATAATGSGVTVTITSISSAGVVSADVAATCAATDSTFTLTVTDNANATATATLTVTVTDSTVATQLVFGQQPTNTTAGATITPAVTVLVQNQCGVTVNSSVQVTVAIASGGGTLGGTTTVTANGGTATFGNLSVNGGAGARTLSASASGLTGAVSNSFNITAPTITVTPTTLPSGVVGAAYSQPITASGGTANYTFAVTAGALPSGLTLSSGGLLSGTPTAAGTFNFTITATDANGFTGSRAYSVTIAAAPTVSLSVSSNNGSEAGATVITVTATLSGGTSTTDQTVTLGTSGTATLGSDYTLSGGNLSGTTLTIPANSTSGSTTFTVIDDAVQESTETATLTISSPSSGITLGSPTLQSISIADNDVAPAFTSADNTAFTVGTAGSFTITTTGSPTPTTITSSGTLPTGVTFVNNGNGTATLAGTPATGTAGTYPLTFTASNGVSPNATQNFTLTITAQSALSINDVTLSEGNSGTTTFTFTVSLNTPAAAGGVTFDIATANGTAMAGSDYTAKTLTAQTIPAGSSSYTFDILVSGDTTFESNETFFVNVTNVTGATVADGQGLGTITNDDIADTTAPVISYMPLPAKLSEGTSTLNVTVTDNIAVQSVSIVYAIGNGAATTANCTPNGGSTYACVINENGATGKTISYYVTATDSSNNSSSLPAMNMPDGYAVGNTTVQGGTYSDLNLNGGTLGGNVTALGTVNFNDLLSGGGFTLEIGCNGQLVRGTSGVFINGNVKKDLCGAQTFTFPVGSSFAAFAPDGSAAIYSPVMANVTAATNPSSLTVSVTDNFMPGSNTNSSISRYWSLTEGGAITANLSFTYDQSDVNGNEMLYKVIKNESGSTSIFNDSMNDPVTNTATVMGISEFSLWSVGNLSPTAAAADISGGVRSPSGRGLEFVDVTLSGGSLTEPLTFTTDQSGRFRFTELPVNETYILTVYSKRYRFSQPTMVFTVNGNLTNISFIGEGR